MGIKLSRPEREAYLQVKSTLRSGNVVSSKKLLKRFVKWVFLYVPSVSVSSVRSLTFWDRVGEKFTLITRTGDDSVREFFLLLILICKVLEDKGKVAGTPLKTTPSVPTPCPPYPSDPPWGGLGGVAHQEVQGCYRLSDSPRSPLPPCHYGTDHPVVDLPVPLLPMPSLPVAPVVPPPPQFLSCTIAARHKMVAMARKTALRHAITAQVQPPRPRTPPQTPPLHLPYPRLALRRVPPN